MRNVFGNGDHRGSWTMAAAVLLAFAARPCMDLHAEEKGANAETSQSGGLFPNDAGPSEIDVSGYPKEMQLNYRLFTGKCSVCHTIARPINSQYLELSAEEMKTAKTDEPELFQDPKVVQPEENVWNRYVKRMMAKPACPIRGPEGKRIWQFLVYDSKIRKTGAHRQEWIAHRKNLLDDFKKNHPADYDRIFGKP